MKNMRVGSQITLGGKFRATTNRVKNDSRCNTKLALHLIPQIFRACSKYTMMIADASRDWPRLFESWRHKLDRFYFGHLSSVTSVYESTSGREMILDTRILRAVRRSGAPPTRRYRGGGRGRVYRISMIHIRV